MDRVEALQTLLAEISFAAFVVDEKGRYFEVWSRREDELLTPIAEMIGTTVRDVLPPSRAIEVEALIEAAIATGQTQRTAFPVPHPNGQQHIAATFVSMETRDGPRVLIALTDYSETERLERELRQSDRRYQAIFDNAPDGIVLFDVASGRFVGGNHRALELFGLTRDELCERTPAEVSPRQQPDGRPSADAAAEWLALAVAGETPVFEWTHRHASGRDFPCEVRLVRLPATDGILVRGSILDISERRAIEDEMGRCRDRCRALARGDLREIQGEIAALAAALDQPGAGKRLRDASRKLEAAVAALTAELEGH